MDHLASLVDPQVYMKIHFHCDLCSKFETVFFLHEAKLFNHQYFFRDMQPNFKIFLISSFQR